jgi:hypothetical protein
VGWHARQALTGEFRNYRSVNPGITHVRFGPILLKKSAITGVINLSG